MQSGDQFKFVIDGHYTVSEDYPRINVSNHIKSIGVNRICK